MYFSAIRAFKYFEYIDTPESYFKTEPNPNTSPDDEISEVESSKISRN